jgi:hypothetical protein
MHLHPSYVDSSLATETSKYVNISSPKPVHLRRSYISHANLDKFPSRSPDLEDPARKSYDLRLPQSLQLPSLPIPAHSNIKNTTPNLPAPLRLASPIARKNDCFQSSCNSTNLSVEETKLPTYTSTVSRSFHAEIDKQFNVATGTIPLYSPDFDDGVDKEFDKYHNRISEIASNLTLSCESDHYNPKRSTEPIIEAQEKRLSSSNYGAKQPFQNMTERNRRQKIKHWAFYMYASLTGVVAVAALVLAALAISHISNMKMLLTSIVLVVASSAPSENKENT